MPGCVHLEAVLRLAEPRDALQSRNQLVSRLGPDMMAADRKDDGTEEKDEEESWREENGWRSRDEMRCR